LQLLLSGQAAAQDIEAVKGELPQMVGALIKNEQDLSLLQRLANYGQARFGR